MIAFDFVCFLWLFTNYLSKKFKTEIGISVSEYIAKKKLMLLKIY